MAVSRRANLDCGAASELDNRRKARIDKRSLQLAYIGHAQQIMAETVALLARSRSGLIEDIYVLQSGGDESMSQGRFPWTRFLAKGAWCSPGHSALFDVIDIELP